ncbi:GIY-YIG nuclease family protein [Novosphingobium terrae]|uniref:GIY-YIG nuclease family protein n=1 Tax=Novosphingobium terrae TaxID=2726189 RepID=UPI00197DFA2A|nr:GIY-YIG nuclease family protein [Novosphingobium terrae]
MSKITQQAALCYPTGHSDGIVTAKLFNWTGRVLMAPRTHLAEALARHEASNSGLYLLLGEIEGEHHAYIGQGEDIGTTIKSHDMDNDWWDRVVFITENSNNLSRSEISYLTSRMMEQARENARIHLSSGMISSPFSIGESGKANMEVFLENLIMVLPSVQVDIFIEKDLTSVSSSL